MTIVYYSRTGSTEHYASQLSSMLRLPSISFTEAMAELENGEEIIYIGAMRMGRIANIDKAMAGFKVTLALGVGLEEGVEDKVREASLIPPSIPLLLLPGAYYPDRLKGFEKFIMKMVTSAKVKELEKKEEISGKEERILNVLKNGGTLYSEEELKKAASLWKERYEEK